MIELMQCPICGNKHFKNLDYMRDQLYWYNLDLKEKNEPIGFEICLECGFVTYNYMEIEKLKQHYDRERPVMNANNIVTCNRKNEYHSKFLKEFFENVKFKNNILDVGCAQGAFLNFMQHKIAEKTGLCVSKIGTYGTEWSKGFRNFAKYEYCLENITTEIIEHQYTFISYYHVLEHIQYPEFELKKIRKLLSDDGYLYVSVPIWFEKLDEPSMSDCRDFENLFHLNHINVFSKTSFKNLLKKCGFEIIKENNIYYGYTVLCKKCEISNNIEKENPEEIEKKLNNYRDAIELFNQKKYLDAINLVPTYTDAYLGLSLDRDNMKNFEIQKDILSKCIEINKDDIKILLRLAKLFLQWDENTPEKSGFFSNNIKESERIFNYLLDIKGGNEEVYWYLSKIEFFYKKNIDKAVEHMRNVYKINPFKYFDCINQIAMYWKAK